MTFVLQRFDEISRTPGFEEMGRTNVELGKNVCHQDGRLSLTYGYRYLT